MVLFVALSSDHLNKFQVCPCRRITSRRCHGGRGDTVALGDGKNHMQGSSFCLVAALVASDHRDDVNEEAARSTCGVVVLSQERKSGPEVAAVVHGVYVFIRGGDEEDDTDEAMLGMLLCGHYALR